MRLLWIVLIQLFFTACSDPGGGKTDDGSASPPPSKKTINAIVSHMTNEMFDPVVLALANIGVARYKDPTTGLKAPRATYKAVGGRSAGWINNTFSKSEANIIDQFKKLDPPPVFSIDEINAAYQEILATHPKDKAITKVNFVLVKDVDVSYLHESPFAKDSILQLASQFNYLESPSSNKTSVSAYIGDFTQGPLGSVEAAAAALHRTAAEEALKLPHALAQVLPSNNSGYYTNGYLELFRVNPTDLNALHQHIEANIGKLNILPQWVVNEASGTKMIQVLSAAPSFQGAAKPSPTSIEGKLCLLLVAAQYEVIGKLAIIRRLALDKPVNVHFTLVGQSAFNNPNEAMEHAFRDLAKAVVGVTEVHVFIHGYGATMQNIIRAQAAKTPTITLTEMEKNHFMTPP